MVGALCSRIILREELLFFADQLGVFAASHVPFYILLGILTGLMSVYYSRAAWRIEALFEPFQDQPYRRALVGGVLLGLLIMLFPPLFGEGYGAVKLLESGKPEALLQDSWLSFFGTNEWLVLGFVGMLALVKVAATTFTIAGGGNGGNFAPSMFVGAHVGFFF
ncbi:chloride channel protein [Pontibacter sp. BAB1700]|uniref:chloride channel protein n=1 Tax=Pontibacter sp. BAB1700 TaxID=1144253 RepID=UPI000316EC62|nr:chloride channel protein [Pontibacter sp. BAB1700]